MGHEFQERVSLGMATRVAARREQHLEWIELARANLARWFRRDVENPSLLRCYAEWSEILQRPAQAVCAVLTAATDEGQRPRLNSPFVGVLPPTEVLETKHRHCEPSRA